MRKHLMEETISILQKQGVVIEAISDINLTGSVTNTFARLIDTHGNEYLVRFNGELWPPFTRENENRNLQQLQSNGTQSHVVYNDPENQLQISLFPNESKRLDVIRRGSEFSYSLNLAASEIRRLHNGNYFANSFRLPQVLQGSFNRLSEEQRLQLQLYFQFILRIVIALNYQQDFVPSHNDLLPSSIYVERNKVTFVDFEYSGNNIRSYDIALLSIKSALTEQEEAHLIASYDPNRAFDMKDALTKTKPVVYFLLFLWNIAANQTNYNEQHLAFIYFFRSVQKLLWTQSGKMLHKENQLATVNSTSVGIYWGTFDPPTLAHLNIALTAMQKCNLSKLIIVINDNTNTGKKYNIDGTLREALWQFMIDDINIPEDWKNRISIVRQTDTKPFSYQSAKEQHPDQRVLAVVGQDSFNSFKKYKASLGGYDHILVVPRGDQEGSLRRDIDQLGVSNVSILPTDDVYLSISSTRARDAIKADQADVVQAQLHRSVIQNIQVHGLFTQRLPQHSVPVTSLVHLNI